MIHLQHLLAYIFVISSVVAIHEAGHYVACKLQGIRVTTFSLGFGPILAKYELWNTLFTLRAIPLGGFIIPAGAANRPETAKKGEYFYKPWYNRLGVVIAGPLTNFILAFVIFAGLLYFKGMPQYSTKTTIGQVQLDSPAYKVGLLSGDTIRSINGHRVFTWAELRSNLTGDDYVYIDRLDRMSHLFLGFHIHIPLVKGVPFRLGILPAEEYMPISLWRAAKESKSICTFQVTQTYDIISSKLRKGDKVELAGPIGIYQAVAHASNNWVEIFSLAAIISLSLGIFNILPIPLLDGGSGVLFIWEGITGKYPSTRAINVLQLLGLAFLGIVLLSATIGDITRLLHP